MSDETKQLAVLDRLCEKLRKNCNRYRASNPQCTTAACLRRGGYVRGTVPVDFSIATCEEHEEISAITGLMSGKWGAYKLHPDGWFRLEPSAQSTKAQ